MTTSQLLVALFASGLSVLAHAQEGSLPERFRKMDRDGDGRISREEWRGPSSLFEQWDTNRDNVLVPSEFPAGLAQRTQAPSSVPEHATSVKDAGMSNFIEGGPVRGPHRRAIAFSGVPKEELRAAGMDVSGLKTVFPEDSRCREIDHIFGEQWKGPSDTLHSGADIPAPYDEPVIAMADGVVIFKSDGMDGGRKARGIQLVLQHAPADTGFPFWLYTLYSHFSKMPDWALGQRVKKGEVLGPNGRSGVPGAKREPHLHLTLLISDSPRFGILNGTLVPEFGRFIDPPAIFREHLPVDTAEMKKLTGDQRKVNVAVMFEDGRFSSPDRKVIWPFRCAKR